VSDDDSGENDDPNAFPHTASEVGNVAHHAGVHVRLGCGGQCAI
jgi:hypothetical protein